MILGSGCFDGLHSGHARYLSALKKLSPSEQVLVAVAPDDYIDTVKKRKPKWSQQDRARTVHECGVRAVVHEQASVAETIRQLKPSAFVKGTDWVGKLPEDVKTACKEVGCLVVYVECPGVHTSEAE